MATAVTVQIKTHGTFAYLRGLSTRARKIGGRETWNLTQFGAKKIKEQHQRTSKKFTGQISKGIRARKLKTNTYGINIPLAGIYLDRMKPHFVPFGKGYKHITAWAKQRVLTW